MQMATQTDSHFSKKPMPAGGAVAAMVEWFWVMRRSVLELKCQRQAALPSIRSSVRPMASSRAFSASRSMVAIGRLGNIEMRADSMRHAFGEGEIALGLRPFGGSRIRYAPMCRHRMAGARRGRIRPRHCRKR